MTKFYIKKLTPLIREKYNMLNLDKCWLIFNQHGPLFQYNNYQTAKWKLNDLNDLKHPSLYGD